MTKKIVKGRIILGDNMKSKDKMKKHMKISIKNIMFVSVFAIILLFLLAIYFSENTYMF